MLLQEAGGGGGGGGGDLHLLFSYLGVKSGKSPAAGGGVEGFARVLQAGSALFPLSLQGVSALLLSLLQLVSHLLSQLCCRLVAESKKTTTFFPAY